MTKKIKFLSMDCLYEDICDNSNKDEKEIANKCTEIEQQQEFIDLFFFANKERNDYYYTEDKETEIKKYLSKYLNIDNLEYEELVFVDYAKRIMEDVGDKEITLETFWGKVVITEYNLIEYFVDCILEGEDEDGLDRIEELIEAENFLTEVKSQLEDCTDLLFTMLLDDAKDELKKFKLDINI